MAVAEGMKQVITQAAIEATKAAVMALRQGSEGSRRPGTGAGQDTMGEMMRARTEGPWLRHPVLNGRSKGK